MLIKRLVQHVIMTAQRFLTVSMTLHGISAGVQLSSGEPWQSEGLAAEATQQANASAGRKGCSAGPIGTTAPRRFARLPSSLQSKGAWLSNDSHAYVGQASCLILSVT